MAPSQLIRIEDLPPEFRSDVPPRPTANDWQANLRSLIEERLARGDDEIFKEFNARFERLLIEAVLRHTGGRKLDAAKKLGWGRNTLTRKLKELKL
jgi:two-component system nitrogen regulation response regulator GlnG